MITKEHIEKSLWFGEREVSKLTQPIVDIKGLTSLKVKSFLNNICDFGGASYLELGAYQGATFCSAIYGNDIKSTAVDNWKDFELAPANISLWQSVRNVSNPKGIFLSNIKKCKDHGVVGVLDENYLTFPSSMLKYKANIVFYDGEHTFSDQYQMLGRMLDFCEDEFILVIDDWNWEKRGVIQGIKDFKFKCSYLKEIFTKGEDPEDFWNGLGIFILKK